jgi:Lon protease-like protein
MSEEREALEDFSGIARLFPLPNVVLFPQMSMPLHIFEPRYRQLTADALAGDRLIAMTLLRPGWESEYEDRPDLYAVACLGRITDEQRLPDGRFNIHLRGLCRVRILQEIESSQLYRSAKVQVLSERPATSDIEKQLRSQMLQVVPDWCQKQKPAPEVLTKVIESNLPFGVVCDVLGFCLPLPMEFKQRLLEELRVGTRAKNLIEYLETNAPPEVLAPPERLFPPEFSVN